MIRDRPPADPVESVAQLGSWRQRWGAALFETAAVSAPVLPGGGWDELTWAYARACRKLEKAP